MHQQLGTNWSWDGETITKANGFLFQLHSSVAFQNLLQVLQILRELTLKLQSKAIDVAYAYKHLKVVSTLRSLKTNSVIEFRKQFLEAQRIGRLLHGEEFELTTPRLTGRQTHHSNPPSNTPEKYFRITLYNEFLAHIVSELEERFLNNPAHSIVVELLYLLPNECIGLANDVMVPEDFETAMNQFSDDLPSHVMFTTEYNLTVQQWKGCSGEFPRTSVTGALRECSALAYPNVHALLKLAAVLPITCEPASEVLANRSLSKQPDDPGPPWLNLV